ncbi:MAG: hypothetical protein J2P45_10485 [Candidatus Dormibacteraeota bacterium]|nr:hypothetical protein [Candidatus Dormibacteraeota bacterium]
MLAVCAFLVSGLPRSLHGTGIVLVVALAVLDLVLVRATGGLAFAAGSALDEREIAVRNLAYRRGFRLLGAALVLAVAIWWVGNIVAFAITYPGPSSQVDSGVSGRFVVAILELVAMMPTLVIAWMEPALAVGRWASLGPPALAGSATVVVWLLTLALAPVQVASPSLNGGAGGVALTSRVGPCHQFVGGRIVGAGFGATVGTHVVVCWDGRRTYVVGAPGGSGTGQLVSSPMGEPTLTACGADSSGDFAVVSGPTCTTRISADGTLHYTFRARVSPLPFEMGAREVTMNLVVTRQGRVLEAF